MSVRTDVINLNVNVNGNAAQNELNNLRKRAADVKLEMEGLGKRTAEFAAKKKELAEINDAMAKLKQEIGLTALSQKELIAELNKLKALKGSVVPFSNEFKELQGQIEKVEARLYDVRNGVTGFAASMGPLINQVKQFGVVAAGYLGLSSIITIVKGLVVSNAHLSDSLAQLKIYMHGSSEDANKLYESLKQLDTRTSIAELLDISTIVAKKGVAKEEIVGVTKALDQLFVVLGNEVGDPHEAVSSLVKLVNVYSEDHHVTADNISNIGAAIQKLTSSGVATGGFLIDFAERMAGVRGITGITIQSVLGLGAALEELGQRNESAATAAQKLITQMFLKPALYAKAAGQTVEEFSKTLAKDPVEALIKVAGALKQTASAPQELIEAFNEMDIKGARVYGVLGDIAGNSEYMRKRLREATAAFGDQGSVVEAFTEKNNTFAATLEKIGKEITSSFQSGVLVDFFKLVGEGVVGLIRSIKSLGQFLSDHKLLIASLATVYTLATEAISLSTLATIKNAVAKRITIALAAAERIAIALSVAAQLIYADVMDLVAQKITLAIARQRIWNTITSLGAGPVGILLVAIGGLIVGIQALIGKVTALSDAQKLAGEIQQRVADATADQMSKIKILTAVVNDGNVSYENRKAALQKLIDLSPDYLKGLTLENFKTQEGINILNNYVGALKSKAEAEARSSLLSDKLKKKNEALVQVQENFGDEFKGKSLDDVEKAVREKMKQGLGSGITSDLRGVDFAALKSTLNQVDILQNDITAKAKENVQQALGTTDKIVKASTTKTLQSLEDQKKALEEARVQMNAADIKGIRANKAEQDKIQKEIDNINGTVSPADKKAATKATHDYNQELKEADKFYNDLLKLKEKAALKDLPQNEAELEAVRQKYADLIAKAKDFLVKKLIDQKKYGQEEKLIEEAKRAEIDALVNKHVKKQEEEDAGHEYDASLLSVQQYYDEQKILRAKDFTDGKLTKIQYDDALKALDKNELSDRITVADNYSEHVKKAASDVVAFKKEQEKKTTADLIAETENRKKIADEEKLSKAQRGVLTARGKGVDGEVDAKKALLQTQFDLDTQYLDKKSELYKLKEAELQDALGQADDDGLQKKIENVMTYVGYFSNALSSLNNILNNKENQQLAIEKKGNDAKKKDLKKQFDDKLISQAQYDKKTQAIDDEQTKHENEVKRKQAIRDKALALFNAVISNAEAVIKTMTAVPFPFNIPLAVAQGVAGGLQIAAIKSKPLPELGTGDWIRTGDKHSAPSRGIPVKIERDEAVMNAAAMTDGDVVSVTGTTAQITSALNSRKGRGVAWAGGAQVTMPKWRTEAPAQINPGLVRYMATGGLGSGETTSAAVAGDDETKGLIRQLISEQQATREELKKSKDRLHAVVSIKEYREEEAKYDAAKNASSIAS